MEATISIHRGLRYVSGISRDVALIIPISFSRQLDKSGLSPTLENLNKIPSFAPLNVPISQVNKTGLGSSAALITSLTAALLVHFDVITRESITGDGNDESRRLAHNLAQFVHCLAQGKVGSGFDVSSAVFGSQVYTRFDPAVIQPLLDGQVIPTRGNLALESC